MFITPPPDVSVAVSIMWLPDDNQRSEFARNQYEKLQNDPHIDYVELIDAVPDGSIYDTFVKAQEWAVTTDATHHVSIQDDVRTCENFGEAAVNALQAVPNRIVSFFTTYHQQSTEFEKRNQWFRSTGKIWGQSIVIPTEFIPEMLDWWDEWIPEDYGSSDSVVWCWNDLEGPGDIWFTVPSLVQHCEREVGGSSVGHNPPCQRRAEEYIDNYSLDAGDIDWSFNFSEVRRVEQDVREDVLSIIDLE